MIFSPKVKSTRFGGCFFRLCNLLKAPLHAAFKYAYIACIQKYPNKNIQKTNRKFQKSLDNERKKAYNIE